MSEFFLYCLILLMTVSTTNFTFSYSKLTRVFFAYGKSVPESSVVTINEEGVHAPPYFDQNILEEKTEMYFLRNIGEGGYSFSFVYEGVDKPQKATLNFKAQVNSLFTFTKKETFSIRKGESYAE